MPALIFGATSLTGGGTGALDAIYTAPGDYTLAAGDAARVTISTGVKHYQVVDSGDSENSPYVIMPDEISSGSPYSGTLRWHLVNTGFEERGDPGSFDYQIGYFTTDNTWRDWDQSAIVPTGVNAIVISLRIYDNAVNSLFDVRKKGNSNVYAVQRLRTTVASVWADACWTVPCDTNQVIQYRASNVTWSNIDVTIMGWHFS